MPPKATKDNVKQPSGSDKFIFRNGSKYEGEYSTLNGAVYRQGKGKYTEALTTLDPYDTPGIEPDEIDAEIVQIFDGMWEQDVFQEGTVTYADGSSYVGKFDAEGNYTEGIYKFVDGSQWQGPFKNCKMNGEGIFVDKNNKRWRGVMEDNFCDAMIEVK